MNEEHERSINTKKYCIYLTLILIIFCVTFWYVHHEQFLADRERYCGEVVENNALYTGQPICANPPLSYYVVFFIMKMFGKANLPAAMSITLALISIIIMSVILSHLKIKKRDEFLLVTLLSLVLTTINFSDFAATVGLLFTVLAYSALIKEKYVLSGILYGLSISAKVIPLLAMPIFIVSIIRKSDGFKKIIKNGLFFLIPTSIPWLLIVVIYPLATHYLFLSHSILHPHWNFIKATMYLSQHFDVQALIIFLITAVGIIACFRWRIREGLGMLLAPWWYIYLTKVNSIFATGEPLFIGFFSHYFTPFLILFITISMQILKGIRITSRPKYWLFYTSLMLVLFYFGLGTSIFDMTEFLRQPSEKAQEAMGLVASFYEQIPYPEGKIVTDKTLAHFVPKKYREKMIISQEEALPSPDHFGYGDINYGSGVASLPFYNSSAVNPKFRHDLEKFSSIVNQTIDVMLKNNVVMILSGPPGRLNPLHFVASYQFKKHFCSVKVPLLKGRKGAMQHAHIFYRNRELCEIAKRSMYSFIVSHFKYFCEFDEYISKAYGFIVQDNGLVMPASCSSGTSGYEWFDTKTTTLRWGTLVLFIVSIIVITVRKKEARDTDSFKKPS